MMLARRILTQQQPQWRAQLLQARWLSTNETTFKVGDIVLCNPLREASNRMFMSEPLKYEGRVETHLGVIQHKDMISKTAGSTVSSSKGNLFRLSFPTTDDYVTKTRRLVTPIYPQDAANIVTLFDIHVNTPPHSSSTEPRPPPLEILEAGTGHGSLTIALAKAIHAANPAQPPAGSNLPAEPRNAIIHTTDANERYSNHAKTVIGKFRRGIYLPHIDFHTGTPQDFIESQFKLRADQKPTEQTDTITGDPDYNPLRKPFLSIIALDLPGPEDYLKVCEEALLPEGLLGVFCPHITQIANMVKMAKLANIRLAPVTVVEFANNGTREWSVKMAKVRNPRPAPGAKLDDSQPPPERWEMVCRPKPGEMVVGGGFFILFKKMIRVVRPATAPAEVTPAMEMVNLNEEPRAAEATEAEKIKEKKDEIVGEKAREGSKDIPSTGWFGKIFGQ